MVEKFAQKRPRSRTDRRRKAVTCWRIDNQSIAITSMLEIAYVIQTHGYFTTPHADLGDWNVKSTLLHWRPVFQWHMLTGVQQPYPSLDDGIQPPHDVVEVESRSRPGMTDVAFPSDITVTTSLTSDVPATSASLSTPHAAEANNEVTLPMTMIEG